MRRAGLLAAALVIFWGCVARAGVITFDVSGTMIPSAGTAMCLATCTLGGDIVIDNSPRRSQPRHRLGERDRERVLVRGGSVHARCRDLSVVEWSYRPGARRRVSPRSGSVLRDPVAGSLVGYIGGALDPTTPAGGGGTRAVWLLTSGSLTPAATVPEPSSVLLLLSALADLGGLFGRRLLPRRTADC